MVTKFRKSKSRLVSRIRRLRPRLNLLPGPFPWLGDPSQGKGPGNEVALVPNTEDCSQDTHDTLFLFFFPHCFISSCYSAVSNVLCFYEVIVDEADDRNESE